MKIQEGGEDFHKLGLQLLQPDREVEPQRRKSLTGFDCSSWWSPASHFLPSSNVKKHAHRFVIYAPAGKPHLHESLRVITCPLFEASAIRKPAKTSKWRGNGNAKRMRRLKHFKTMLSTQLTGGQCRQESD